MPHFMESDEVASCLIVITVHDVEVEPAKWRDVVTIGYNEDVFPGLYPLAVRDYAA